MHQPKNPDSPETGLATLPDVLDEVRRQLNIYYTKCERMSTGIKKLKEQLRNGYGTLDSASLARIVVKLDTILDDDD